ncbi:MAG: extracellular solute-binding protein [Neisseriaceae bacterium]|nr:extracellular solute-binding protein [Neisseriaceae bacterium]
MTSFAGVSDADFLQVEIVMKNKIFLFAMTICLTACDFLSNKTTPIDVPMPEDRVKASVPQDMTFLNLYLQKGIISDGVVDTFAKANNVKISINRANSQNDWKQNDIILSDLLNISWLQLDDVYYKLDKTLLPNYSNISPEILAMLSNEDLGNQYLVPYAMRVVVVGINRTAINEILEDSLPENPLDLVFNPQYTQQLKQCGIAISDNPNEVIPLLLHYLRLNPHAQEGDEINTALEHFRQIREDINYFDVKPIEKLINNEACVALTYGSDVKLAHKTVSNIPIEALVPTQGTGLLIDIFAIPASVENRANAHKFINEMLSPNVSAQITSFNARGYTVNMTAALQSRYINDNSIFLNNDTMDKSFILRPLPEQIYIQIKQWWQNE